MGTLVIDLKQSGLPPLDANCTVCKPGAQYELSWNPKTGDPALPVLASHAQFASKYQLFTMDQMVTELMFKQKR